MVTGVTNSVTQCRIAHRESALDGLAPKPDFRLGSFDHEIEGVFTGAYAIESLVHSSNLVATLQHIARALIPNSCLLVVDDYWPNKGLENPKLDTVAWGVHEFWSHNEIVVSAESAGLIPEMVIDLSDNVKVSSKLLRGLVGAVPDPSVGAASLFATQLNFWKTQAQMHSMIECRQQLYIATLFRRI